MEKITDKTIQALKIVDVSYDNLVTAHQFAKQMWPDSKAWTKVYNTGNGATSGKGLWLSAGSYLGKLRKRDLVYHDYFHGHWGWKITAKGKEILKEHENKKQLN